MFGYHKQLQDIIENSPIENGEYVYRYTTYHEDYFTVVLLVKRFYDARREVLRRTRHPRFAHFRVMMHELHPCKPELDVWKHWLKEKRKMKKLSKLLDEVESQMDTKKPEEQTVLLETKQLQQMLNVIITGAEKIV